MFPTLVSIGPLSLSSFGVLMSIAFILLAFSVWKHIRDAGIEDEKIFDHLIAVSVFTFFGARIFFAFTHWNLFQSNLLAVVVPWSYPGLNFWGGLLFGCLALFLFAKKMKISVGLIADGYAKAIPLAMIFGSLAILLDGTVKGKATNWFTAMPQTGELGNRHPIGLYAAILSTFCLLIIALYEWGFPKKQIPKGVFGWAVLSFIGLVQLLLAFVREDLLYFGSFSLDYTLASLVFLVPLVPLIKALGGGNAARKVFTAVRNRIKKK